MSGFRKKKDVLRELSGSYVNGQWVSGARSTFSIMASVQPVDVSDISFDLQSMPEGRRMSDYIKIYTTDLLQMAENGLQPDILVGNGYGFELVSIAPNQSGVINHYKYIAVKIFKFTSIADWLSGVLKRDDNG